MKTQFLWEVLRLWKEIKKTIYIIRFRENIEIKTIKLYDKESAEYITQQLEDRQKQYVIIKVLENALKHDVNDLLDYEI